MRALALIALLSSPGWGQDPSYDTLRIEAGRRTDRILARDVNGDGRLDLVIQGGRDLHLFLFQAKAGFPPKPDASLRLDGTVFLWTFGALEGGKFPVLLTAGSRAVQAHPFDGRAFATAGTDLVVHPSLFEGTSDEERPPLALDFAPDLDGDGRSEILLFGNPRLLILKRPPGGDFRCLQKLLIPVHVETAVPWILSQRLTHSTSFPLMAFGDVDGDGLQDLTYYRDETIGVFRRSAEGRFSPVESYGLASQKRKTRERLIEFEIPPKMGDFNKDGLLDLALVDPSKGRVHLYYGRAGRKDFAQPDDVKRAADGWSTGIYLDDLNGDGRPDLVMGVVRKFGVAEGIQAFLSGKVDLELHFYPMEASGAFSKDPVQELQFSIPYSFHVTQESASLDLVFRPNFQGDFDGDGRRDMLVPGEGKTLRIYPGAGDRLIRSEPSGTIHLEPPAGVSTTEPFVTDFNGDGLSDLVLKHTLIDPPGQVLEIKLSRKR